MYYPQMQPPPAQVPPPKTRRTVAVWIGVIGVGVVLLIGGFFFAFRSSFTAFGGCWYVHAKSANLLAVHLPRCDGAEADVQRQVMVNTLNLFPGSEPPNAREVCQVKIGGNDPTAWIGIWANSANSTAMGAGQELCQLASDSGSGIRWSNFH